MRVTLADFLRHQLGLTGTHLGCEHGVCGACTILLDGHSARSCLMLAVQADGHDIVTVEGIAPDAETLHPLQQAFRDNHGLQCGFCTPGILTTLIELLRDNPDPTEEESASAFPAICAAAPAIRTSSSPRSMRRSGCVRKTDVRCRMTESVRHPTSRPPASEP